MSGQSWRYPASNSCISLGTCGNGSSTDSSMFGSTDVSAPTTYFSSAMQNGNMNRFPYNQNNAQFPVNNNLLPGHVGHNIPTYNSPNAFRSSDNPYIPPGGISGMANGFRGTNMRNQALPPRGTTSYGRNPDGVVGSLYRPTDPCSDVGISHVVTLESPALGAPKPDPCKKCDCDDDGPDVGAPPRDTTFMSSSYGTFMKARNMAAKYRNYYKAGTHKIRTIFNDKMNNSDNGAKSFHYATQNADNIQLYTSHRDNLYYNSNNTDLTTGTSGAASSTVTHQVASGLAGNILMAKTHVVPYVSMNQSRSLAYESVDHGDSTIFQAPDFHFEMLQKLSAALKIPVVTVDSVATLGEGLPETAFLEGSYVTMVKRTPSGTGGYNGYHRTTLEDAIQEYVGNGAIIHQDVVLNDATAPNGGMNATIQYSSGADQLPPINTTFVLKDFPLSALESISQTGVDAGAQDLNIGYIYAFPVPKSQIGLFDDPTNPHNPLNNALVEGSPHILMITGAMYSVSHAAGTSTVCPVSKSDIKWYIEIQFNYRDEQTDTHADPNSHIVTTISLVSVEARTTHSFDVLNNVAISSFDPDTKAHQDNYTDALYLTQLIADTIAGAPVHIQTDTLVNINGLKFPYPANFRRVLNNRFRTFIHRLHDNANYSHSPNIATFDSPYKA